MLNVIDLQREESKLFQFLNGVDEIYNSQRSQLLMMTPLPNVEVACSVLMQEEAQREILQTIKPDDSILAMFSKSTQPKPPFDRNITCSACGVRGHSGEKCWTVIGYPKWHTKHSTKPLNNNQSRPKRQAHPQKWTPGNQNTSRMAAAVKTGDGDAAFTPQQLEQLAKLLPQLQAMNSSQCETDEELDHFSGMITCFQASSCSTDWIVDSGASDHMTSHVSGLVDPKSTTGLHITLPTGSQVAISHVGAAVLPTGLRLEKVLCVPNFKHNLLSVQKLIKDSNCAVHFFPTHCLILDNITGTLMGVGEAKQGLYYMADHLNRDLPEEWFSALDKRYLCSNIAVSQGQTSLELWHNRLGHMPFSKMKQIAELSHLSHNSTKVCLTCPLAKFTKLPYTLSASHAANTFDLVHIDIWGPYKVCTKGKFRFFLTIVDDKTRHTWVYLLQHKYEALKTIETFMNYIHTHFMSTIKTLRSDNALEFDDVYCRQFFVKKVLCTKPHVCIDLNKTLV